MKKRSTRQRIAGSMALLTGSVVLVVVVVLNVLMITNMYRGERRALGVSQRTQATRLGRRTPRNIILTPQESQALDQGRVRRNLTKVEGERFIFVNTGEKTVARQVTGQVERQIMMLWMSLIVVLVAGLLAFGVAWWLTKRVMSDIETLTSFVEGRAISNLDESLVMDHLPGDDILARLTSSVNTTNHLLLEQIDKIKQFALYAAHELKSPLMSMQGSIDLGLKTQNYHKYMQRLQQTVSTMQGTIETLLMTVDSERSDETTTPIVLKHLLAELCDEAQSHFGSREVQMEGDPAVVVEARRGVMMTVLRNLIDNAWKYHESTSPITISRSSSSVTITNISDSLSHDDLGSIWTPFWQRKSGSTDGQGLGLNLVDAVASRMGWDVTITLQEPNTVTTTVRFTV